MSLAQEIGIGIPNILLPKPSMDLKKWSVIACDQFTSEPEYWQDVKEIVSEAPSTYHMILPEVYLGTPEEEKRITGKQAVMQAYLKSNIFRQVDDLIYILRTVGDHTRRGLMVCLDLEQYDFHQGAKTLIRATEGTILDRLPPRIHIREKAPLECPHILVLFDDPNDSVFGPLDAQVMHLEEVYDFDLMLGSGHLTGLAVTDENVRERILSALRELINPEIFAEKYNLKPGLHKPLLFAMGDGNHSLATAKAIWEKMKPKVGMNHPARYALVEIENIHDPALTFEPIHRLVFDQHEDLLEEMQAYWGEQLTYREMDSLDTLTAIVDDAAEPWHQIGMVLADGLKLLEIHNPSSNLPVGTLQAFMDSFLAEGGADRIDYIHGTETLFEKSKAPGNAGFYVPAMDKSDLFKTVILDGALPRKTFSMGEAKEKRFYLECRRIQAA